MELIELRIGNKILCNKEEIDVCINDFCEWEDNESIYCLEPIELTDEWLFLFGFKIDDGSFVLKSNDYEILRYYYDGWVMSFETEFYNCIIENIDYVHQLQNLYFALSGKDLTIK